MSMPRAFACALALALSLTAPAPVIAQAATPPAASPKAASAWVARSNEHTRVLLEAQAPFMPEQLSFLGIPGYDDRVFDYGPEVGRRFREATANARRELERRARIESDPNVRQDLAILIQAADDAIRSSTVEERLTRPWLDVGQAVFQGVKALLSEQTPASRRAHALTRLQRYAGLAPGSTAVATLARQRYEERTDSGLLEPTRAEVEQALQNLPTYLEGVRALFAEYKLEAGPALDALEKQLQQHAEWTREQVLPRARTEARIPAELYALRLRDAGIDIEPQVLIERAQLEFMETRNAMQQLAPLVAREKQLAATDYMDVIRALKRSQLPDDRVEAHYRTVVMPKLEELIAQHRVVTLPKRAMQMRLGTPAESAAQPAPHFLPAPLVGNTGQQGTFVLPLGNPGANADGAYDDFNYPAGAWTLAAHEGRPGHELQFTAMVERGISLARTLYAFNSVNVEGWALYAEAEMVPYEPLEGQLIALQFRLLRAARAMLDPMLNLGLIDRDTAFRVLTEQVGFSKAMARQEVDRYSFRMPGQAGSYFYGYARLMQLRAETELALGERFDRKAFNDFLLDQGLLPPDLLAEAVRDSFVPAQRARTP